MILGSHNSWSYLTPKKWWMKVLNFNAKCQEVDIKTQYEKYGVRCFDLRVKFTKYGTVIVNHNIIEYNITSNELTDTLLWLNEKNDVDVRIVLDIRKKKDLTIDQIVYFKSLCDYFKYLCSNINFWYGRDLCDNDVIYDFSYKPSCEEVHASVCTSKTIVNLCPKWFAKKNNRSIIQKGTDRNILLIDFVNIT